MSNWKSEVLVNCLESIIDYRGKTPKKSDQGIVTLSAKSVKMGEILYDRAFYISKETYTKFMVRGFPKTGDILLTTEAPLGCVARLDRDDVGLAQRLITLRGKRELLDNGYLLYFLMSNIGQHELHVRATGTTVQGINRSEFEKVKINLPPLPEQKAIAHVLGKLDDKIELNRQMNQTLEAMAQALFKSWFVDFDPVLDNALAAGKTTPNALKAKAEKRKLVSDNKKLLHTNPELAALFPSSFVFNETLDKWVPEGWEVKKLQELVTIKYGKDHKKLAEGDVPCYGSGGVMRLVERALFEGESVLIPRKGTLNNIIYINNPFWSVDTMFYTIMEQSDFAKYFFYTMKRLNFSEMNEGSAVPSMTTAQLNSMDLILPSYSSLSSFDSIISKYFLKMESNNQETETLTKLRDTLLPQLISGKVRVPVEMMEGD